MSTRTQKSDGSQASRRSLNALLKSQGQKPLGARVAKGILDRWRAMTPDERMDEFDLRAQGIDPDVARALAMTGNARPPKRVGVFGKAAKAEASVAKSAYATAYRAAAKAALPADVDAAIHRTARASAGGQAAREARLGQKSEQSGAVLRRAKRLKKRSDAMLARLAKMGPTLAEFDDAGHADGMLSPKRKPRTQPLDDILRQLGGERQAKSVRKRHMVAQLADQYVTAAYGPIPMAQPEQQQAQDAQSQQFLNAQRLVAGMDAEVANGAQTPTMARARASAALAARVDHYDREVENADKQASGVGGLNLDLGSGASRQRGFLGLDLYPYDYGTVLWDVGLGLPFADGSARSVRLVNALASMPDYAQDPTPLLREIQRVLTIGGVFYYVGQPIQDSVDWSQLGGLGVVSSQFDDGGTVMQLTLRRIPRKLPLVYGADTNFLAVDERYPADSRVADATFGDCPPADVAMANLVAKRQAVDVRARVVKADAWQRKVSGVVLAPDEVDSQGDIMSADEIEKTAHDFLANARVVGRQHSEVADGANVVESYIAPVDMSFDDSQFGPQTVKKGSWVMAVQLPKDDFDAVLRGDFTGFSVGGFGERVDV